MNDMIMTYREMIAEAMNLPCAETDRYLRQIQPMLELFLEDNQAPSLDDLMQAFGPAEHMAQILLRT